METIAVPLIQAATRASVESAIAELKRRQRVGLIVEKTDDYQLLYIRHLLEAKRDQITLVSEITGGYSVHLLTPGDMQSFGLDLVRPMQTQLQYENFFASPIALKKDYALVGATPDTAIIVTRHETLKYMLAATTGGFQCNGTPKNHFFPDPDVVDGQDCPKYPECTLPGGGTPVISPV
jgi:hypothetical protein